MMCILDKLKETIRAAAAYNPEVQTAPVCILWPDHDRQWEPAIARLQNEMPELLVLEEYAPEKWTTHGPLRTDATVLQIALARLLGYRWPAELESRSGFQPLENKRQDAASTMELSDEQQEWVNRCNALLPYADDQQPMGWHPDLNDGVRLNIRPFMTVPDVGKRGAGVLRDKPNIHWKKDRGKDVPSAPWYHLGSQYGGNNGDRINDHHLTIKEKQSPRKAKGELSC